MEYLQDLPELFDSQVIGYWAHGRPMKGRGWLIFEQPELDDLYPGWTVDDILGLDPELDGQDGTTRYVYVHRFGPDKAVEAVRHGLEQFGPNFQQQWDAQMMDQAVQLSVFRKIKYG
jgi:hypothetical protein